MPHPYNGVQWKDGSTRSLPSLAWIIHVRIRQNCCPEKWGLQGLLPYYSHSQKGEEGQIGSEAMTLPFLCTDQCWTAMQGSRLRPTKHWSTAYAESACPGAPAHILSECLFVLSLALHWTILKWHNQTFVSVFPTMMQNFSKKLWSPAYWRAVQYLSS